MTLRADGSSTLYTSPALGIEANSEGPLHCGPLSKGSKCEKSGEEGAGDIQEKLAIQAFRQAGKTLHISLDASGESGALPVIKE